MSIRSASAALVLVAFPALTAVAQQLVANGGFESPVVGGAWVQRFPGETFGGWTVDGDDTQGIVQVAGFGQPLAAEGAQCLELNFYVQGGLSQTLATVPNATYILTFLMAGQLNAGPDVKTMRIDWAGQPLGVSSWSRSQTGGAWVGHRFRVQATSAQTVLHFRGLQDVDGGPYLDAVSVVRSECLADFNGDGFLDFFDYDDYVNCFEGGACPPGNTADFNEDGFVDFFDYDGFVELFEAGC